MNQTRKEKPFDGLLLHICEVCDPEDLPELPDGGYSLGSYGTSWKES